MRSISWRDWYYLTKPGIVYGNGIHFIAGFLLASRGGVELLPGVYGLVGTSLLIASACVVNNYFDRDIDARMKRTRKRPSVTGKIPVRYGAMYAAFLLLAAVAVLAASGQWLVLTLGLVAYVLYTLVYTYSKRVTVHSTLIGSIPGAIPAMAGFVVPTGALSTSAWLVFLAITAWQMPHFYAISLFRRKEYKEASLPVMGVVASLRTVQIHMVVWCVLYVAAIAALLVAGVYAPFCGIIMLGASGYWLITILGGFGKENTEKWARKVFGQSLLLTLLFSVVALINVYL